MLMLILERLLLRLKAAGIWEMIKEPLDFVLGGILSGPLGTFRVPNM